MVDCIALQPIYVIYWNDVWIAAFIRSHVNCLLSFKKKIEKQQEQCRLPPKQ